MYRGYSRLHSLEEKRNIKKSILFIFLAAILIIGIIFVGLPMVAKFSIFLGNFKKSNAPVEVNDITPPAPPRFEPLPDATNISSLTIKGSSENAATIIISINNREEQVIANNNGFFSFSTSLLKGENTLWATAKDKSGNISQPSQKFIIIFDNEPPILEITAPNDNSQFYGIKQQQQQLIKGKTERDALLTINDRFVKVDENGDFSFFLILNDGENHINIKSSDKASNTSEKNIKLTYTP
jgi:hypothetical protein